MTDRFAAELTRTERPFQVLRGSRERRLSEAVAAVDRLLAADWGLTDPLPERRGDGDARVPVASAAGKT
jgi:hypothetical protein